MFRVDRKVIRFTGYPVFISYRLYFIFYFIRFPVVNIIAHGLFYPDGACRILGNGFDVVIVSFRLGRGGFLKWVAVVAVESVKGGKPHETIPVA